MLENTVENPPPLDLPPPADQNDAFESATGLCTAELCPPRTASVALKRALADLTAERAHATTPDL